jgi:uncharacterized integral membrane protein
MTGVPPRDPDPVAGGDPVPPARVGPASPDSAAPGAAAATPPPSPTALGEPAGTAPAAGVGPGAEGGPAAASRGLPQHRIERTRAGGLWVAVAAAALVLLFLLIFILQNGQQVQVSFLGAKGRLPVGVGMLLSAVAGALLVVLIGTARIVQLRLIARRHRTAERKPRQS